MSRKRLNGILKVGAYSLLVISLFFFFDSCKQESDIYPDDVTINFKVYDDLQAPVIGAKIYLFGDFQSYQDGLAWNPGTYAVDSSISTLAGISFKLKAETNYWVIVNYNDVVRSLKLTNTGISSQLDKFAKGSVVNSNINIGPSNANISFWTGAGNNLPISVHFNGQVIDIASNSLTSPPTGPGNPNALNFSVPTGIYPYYAVGANNCVWTGSLNVKTGTFTQVQLNQCDRGTVNFYNSQASTPGVYPITVVLDNFDNVGAVQGAHPSFICGDPADPNVLTVSKAPGTYTYVATTNDGRCVWTGTFTIAANSCIPIQLPFCP